MNRLAMLLLGSLSVAAVAEEVEPLQAEVELGVIATSGNTETASLTGRANVKQDFTKWKSQYILEGLYKKDELEIEQLDGSTEKESRTTAQKYFLSGQADYKLNAENRGLFFFGSYENDRFSGFEYQSTVAVGYSDRLFETENSHFDYSVGPGVAFAKTEPAFDDDGILIQESETTTTGVVRVAFEYLYRFSENAKFTQTVASDLAVDLEKNSRTRSETALTANISSGLAMKLSYLINQNTHVNPGKKHADTQAAVTLVFSF